MRLQRKSTYPSRAGIQEAGAQFINNTIVKNGIRLPQETRLKTDAPILLFEVPADFQAVKAASMQNALTWIEHTREVFEACFRDGYVVSEFISEVSGGERRNFFVLQRDLSTILNKE